MAPDEYYSAVVALCERYGSEQFDAASRKPAQYMFRPAAQDPSFFRSWHNDGPLLVVDDLLDEFVEDLSTLDMPRVNATKRNPSGRAASTRVTPSGQHHRDKESPWISSTASLAPPDP